MIDDLDDVLRKLLVREMPIKNREVEITFDQPRREWSSRQNRPTLNLFLFDIRENATLRAPEWEIKKDGNGKASRRRSAIRLDLHYMITTWASKPEDEHLLLARCLMALYRWPLIPEDLLPEILRDQPSPIPLRVASHDKLTNPAEIWSSLDNEMRPAISMLITLALNPYQEFTGPLVRSRQLRFGQADDLPLHPGLDPAAGEDQLWVVGGTLHSRSPLTEASLTLLERGLTVPIRDGRFIIGNLESGEYTLELAVAGSKPSRHTIRVPSADYDLRLDSQSD
mgnify:CR=1 FL=1